MNHSPRTYTLAAVLRFLGSLYSIVFSIPLLARGAAAINQSTDSPPYFILVLAFFLGTLGLIGAYGVWRNEKWGVVLTLVVTALDGLSALPGVIFAPTTRLWIEATIGVLLCVVIVTLLLWPRPSHNPTTPTQTVP